MATLTKTKSTIELPAYITVRDLATAMSTSPITVIKELMANGIMANINQQIDFDTAAIVASELGFDAIPHVEEVQEPEEEEEESLAWRKILAEEEEKNLVTRPPVVTILGHVDHGKTSLLDVIRSTNVTSTEAGGITQHIGAYQIEYEGQTMTFLDTPGHEAFTAMRARGAQVTDIAILVVAADDGVMPQTVEAADHAKAARVPIIVALNKIDLPGANPPRVKQQLMEIGLTPDEWDGNTLVIPVSARQKRGIEDLLGAILLTTEEINPRANPNAAPTGSVLEAKVEKGLGNTITLLVQNGTLKVGETLLIGEFYGRIRSMFDHKGKHIKKAGPSAPVSVTGLTGIPKAGDQFRTVTNETVARKIVSEMVREKSNQVVAKRAVSLEDFFIKLESSEIKTLNLIVKADVQGSLEPIVNSLKKLHLEEVNLNILRAATGEITENDIMLAAASKGVVVGFNVGMDAGGRLAMGSEGVQVKTYTIIYNLLEDVERALKGLKGPTYQDVIIGRGEVRQLFRIRNVGTVAGCFMRTGEARRNSHVRVIRAGKLLHTGSVGSLKHLHESVREVKAGFEFGVSVNGWEDFQPGDLLEFFVTQRVEL